MDFSTVERRRVACEAELRLNRRSAPMLYERVATITREPRGLAFDGPGEVVDHVVVMRRFDQDALFDRMADAGRLTPALMEALADHVAAFHEGAEIHREVGGAASMTWLIDLNRAEFARLAAILPAERTAAIDRACRALAANLAPLLDARQRQGSIRRCHGDLHLRNICLIDGAPVLFDAIEFNDSIAIADTLYDFAFLLMDLEHRGRRDLANAAFNRYRDATGEGEGLAALPLFMAIRAGIRAHVEASAAASDPTRRPAHDEAARAYLELAARLLDPPPARLVAIGGLSGTGKTTLAKRLAPSLGRAPGAVILRTDVLRKRQAGIDPATRLPDSAYTMEKIAGIYAVMEDAARSILAAGQGVIADGVFAKPEERAAITAIARDLGVRFDGLWLDASPTVLETRIAARARDASDATPEVLHKQLGYDLGAIDWLRLDASPAIGTIEETARRLLI
jgi:aminoglycoside phosphotransferase family enzyme/predicted kinase